MRRLIAYDRDRIGTLHCDWCGYETPERVSLDPKWIGTPCPRCAQDMLTARDYRGMVRLVRCIDVLNFVLSPLLLFVRKDAKAEDVSIKVHDGVLDVRHEEDEK